MALKGSHRISITESLETRSMFVVIFHSISQSAWCCDAVVTDDNAFDFDLLNTTHLNGLGIFFFFVIQAIKL